MPTGCEVGWNRIVLCNHSESRSRRYWIRECSRCEQSEFVEGATALNANQTYGKILQRGRHGPARDLRAGPRQLATPHGARMADGPLPRLFRDHVDVLHRLAPAFRGRGSPHGRRRAAGGPASFDAGSLVQSFGCIMWRRRGAGGGSAG